MEGSPPLLDKSADRHGNATGNERYGKSVSGTINEPITLETMISEIAIIRY